MRKLIRGFNRVDSIFRFALLAGSSWEVWKRYQSNFILLIVVLIPIILLVLYEVGKKKSQRIRSHLLPLLVGALAVCLAAMAADWGGCLQVYYFFLMDDIFACPKGKPRNALLLIHFLALAALLLLHLLYVEREPAGAGLWDILTVVAGYAILWFVFSVIHSYREEMERLQALNCDLVEYMFREREYAAARERTEISQQLHDSLGHTLTAALMNVRYLKAILPKDPQAAAEEVDEVEGMLQDSIQSLRQSVGSLRSLEQPVDLRAELQHIAEHFNRLRFVTIRFQYQAAVDKASSLTKAVLYRNIREAITNSIRHGNATEINISTLYKEKKIVLEVQDNGEGCAEIKPSYGLNGIRERTEKLGGHADFFSGRGFLMRNEIPEELSDDLCDDCGRPEDSAGRPEENPVAGQ